MFEAFHVAVPVVCFTVMIAGLVWTAVHTKRTLAETDDELRARAPRVPRAVEAGCARPVSIVVDVSDVDWAWPPFVPYGRPVLPRSAGLAPESSRSTADADQASAVSSSELRSERRALWGA